MMHKATVPIATFSAKAFVFVVLFTCFFLTCNTRALMLPSLSLAQVRAAAEKGDVQAQYNLGEMYQNGEGMALNDDAQAVFWYRKAAGQGDATARYYLGMMYYQGKGVAQDYTQAIFWWRKEAEQGDGAAQYALGNMYRDGKGVAQDYAQAVFWYRKAAGQGEFAEAQNELGKMYRDGKGVARSDAQAIYWFQEAAGRWSHDAQDNLVLMYSQGRIVIDCVQAGSWLREIRIKEETVQRLLASRGCPVR